MTAEEWLWLRLDTPPQLVVVRNKYGGWDVAVVADGGYRYQEDAASAADRIGSELRQIQASLARDRRLS